VAIGALPFAPDRAGELVVPEVTVGRAEDGTRWITTIIAADAPADGHDELVDALLDDVADPPTGRPSATATDYRVTATRPAAEWCDAVASARDELRAGTGDKVVLAREVVVEAGRPIDRQVVLQRLRTAYPACMVYAVDGFVGASPELLVARTGDLVRSHPMAGTAPAATTPPARLRLRCWPPPGPGRAPLHDRHGARHVAAVVLVPRREPSPHVIAMANVQHLATLVEDGSPLRRRRSSSC
jgi:menaquinone-specific isochorismate synthase